MLTKAAPKPATATVEVLVGLALFPTTGEARTYRPGDIAQWPADDLERAVANGVVRRCGPMAERA